METEWLLLLEQDLRTDGLATNVHLNSPYFRLDINRYLVVVVREETVSRDPLNRHCLRDSLFDIIDHFSRYSIILRGADFQADNVIFLLGLENIYRYGIR